MATPPPGVPSTAWYENATMTWYDDIGMQKFEVDEAGTILRTIAYTEAETIEAQQRQNRVTLIARAKAAITANNTDITNADAIAANTGLNVAIRTLGAQSSRQAKELNALIRLVVEDLTSVEGT